MMASRGVEIDCVYFDTPPYTSSRAKQKVIDLAHKLLPYVGRLNLYIVNFTAVQLAINEKGPAELITILMRRMMMRLAENIATKKKALSLITGESLGQVASQTMEALFTTDAVVSCPVFRPLVGMDKDETIKIAKKIGTFQTSIEPYEDCCTVFVAKHPKTRPSLSEVLEAEQKLDIDHLMSRGLEEIHTYHLALGKETKEVVQNWN